MNIAVFGLGYVGMVNIACLSKLGHKIYGCDVKPHKVELVKNGKSTILEPGIDELLEKGHADLLIEGNTDAGYCVANTEMALICVGTPSDSSGQVNLNYILNTARDIATALLEKKTNYTMVFRSTIPPGTIEEHILPIIKEILGDALKRVNLIFLPEFLREGSAVKDFFNCARIVVGCNEMEDGKVEMSTVFGFSPSTPLIFTSYKTAEFVKYVDNAYHATKVAFANEIYSIGSSLGVDVKHANDIFLMDDILNISGRYLKPGTPFGGSCLPKDSRAIIQLAETAKVDIPFFRGLIISNQAHQKRLLAKVLAFRKDKVLIHGLTFKQKTDDIRESPFLILLDDLIKEGLQVRVVDSKLNLMNLRVEFPHIIKFIEPDEQKGIKWADVVVLNDKAIDRISSLCIEEQIILNCVDNNNYGKSGKKVYNLY